MIFNFRKRERQIDDKEKAISESKRQLHRKMNKDLRALKELNKVLSNGVTLEIKKGMGAHHD